MKTRLSIVRCSSYDPKELKAGIKKAFDLLGGMPTFIKDREKVLIKPNILSARPAADGVNTHTEVIRALVRLVKECQAIPLIGDNPGGSITPKQAYEGSGIFSLAKAEGVELLEPKDVKMVNGFPVASYCFECDKIISVPKMKTHGLTQLTGAIKNMYGAVKGLSKTQYHKRFPRPEEFSNVLVDVFEAVKPHLVLMDGIVAMDGDGPASGNLKNIGLLIASRDSVAVDSVFSYLIGIEPLDILTTKLAYKRGLGQADIEDIEILGEKVGKGFVKGFKLPRSGIVRRLPKPIIKMLADLIKFGPYINERLCKKCGVCLESCPVSCITIDENRSIIDYNRCIKCMCCHEVCPYRAVELRRNIFARVVGL